MIEVTSGAIGPVVVALSPQRSGEKSHAQKSHRLGTSWQARATYTLHRESRLAHRTAVEKLSVRVCRASYGVA